MSRTRDQNQSAPGHDSFLDVVTNIVGILIILVMVVGLRATNAPVELPEDAATQAAMAALQREQGNVVAVREEVLKVAGEIRRLQAERLARELERNQLAVVQTAWEQRIQSRRGQLDGQSQQAFDLQQAVSEARFELEDLQRRASQAEQPAGPIVVESYPTPLSKPVDGEEAHFQLRGGRLAYIPLEELLKRFMDDARRKVYKLFELPELTDTVGPLGGFRLRYTMERQDVSLEEQMTAGDRGGGGTYARLKRWTLIPVSGELGEPIDVALGERSELRRILGGLRPEKTTITIWTYPDSFAEFRRLKKELYRMGFAAAGRPLPDGTPIGGSPEGTKSAAQ